MRKHVIHFLNIEFSFEKKIVPKFQILLLIDDQTKFLQYFAVNRIKKIAS